jgi:hypothetical protein
MKWCSIPLQPGENEFEGEPENRDPKRGFLHRDRATHSLARVLPTGFCHLHNDFSLNMGY